jgi:hypothetical protein
MNGRKALATPKPRRRGAKDVLWKQDAESVQTGRR